MNHLQFESSPYLLQHAHNPVDWYPWGETALQRARDEDKPILVSIGYAACHWCHVMERESFEDARTAAFMNEFFINIKIDREERPDLDNIYMNACQLLTGAGGWPLNVFLTPEQLPFSAGTYYPPKPGYGKPAWMDVLMYMHNVFTNERDKVEAQAQQLASHILKMDNAFVQQLTFPEGGVLITEDELNTAVKAIRQQFDTVEGGFGNAPKFPGAMTLRFLLRYGHTVGDERSLAHVKRSLDKMRFGGIYDHLGGGFARYAVDQKWMIPHFEKMLYDNALLAGLYAESYRATQDIGHKETMEDILKFTEREMMSDDGGFYAAYDADSEGVEGKFYTFTFEEVEQVLGDDAPLACAYYNIEKDGNWEHTNILFRANNTSAIATQFGLTETELENKCKDIRARLFNYRALRVKPGLDHKIILGWNALMCSAFAEAFKSTGDAHYRMIAKQSAHYMLTAFADQDHSDRFFHNVTNGVAAHPAFLEDLAALISALLDVYDITGDTSLLDQAENISDHVIINFSSADHIFYFTAKYQTDIPLRSAEFYDNATPSGNSMMAMNLRRLYAYTGKSEYEEHAAQMLLNLKSSYLRYGTSFGNWLMAALTVVDPFVEIAVTGPEANAFRDEILLHYFPNAVYVTDERGLGSGPLLEGRFDPHQTRIFMCRHFACNQPVTSVQDFLTLTSSL